MNLSHFESSNSWLSFHTPLFSIIHGGLESQHMSIVTALAHYIRLLARRFIGTSTAYDLNLRRGWDGGVQNRGHRYGKRLSRGL